MEIRGLDSKATTAMRGNLRSKGIRVTVVKNALARRTFKGGPLAGLEKSLKGPSALLTGAESAVIVAREIVKVAEAEKKIVLKAAIFERLTGRQQTDSTSMAVWLGAIFLITIPSFMGLVGGGG